MSLFRAALSTRVRDRRPGRAHRAAAAAGLTGAVLAVDALVGVGTAGAAPPAELQSLAQCESGGNYTINTGNGYYGAYQFSLGTWRSLGYDGYPHEAPPPVQDAAAAELQARSGWGQWPACSRKLGLNSPRGSLAVPPPAPLSPIDAHYAADAEARGHLGAPRGGEFAVSGGAVRLYEQGQIVFSAATGAKAVYGEIFRKYGEYRWEQGPLGFPVSDELSVPGGRQNLFRYGVIVWSPSTGAHVLHGDIRLQYEAMGGVSGPLGFPTSSARPEAGGVTQSFEGGSISLAPGGGPVVVTR